MFKVTSDFATWRAALRQTSIPEAVTAMLRLRELGWGSRRIARDGPAAPTPPNDPALQHACNPRLVPRTRHVEPIHGNAVAA